MHRLAGLLSLSVSGVVLAEPARHPESGLRQDAVKTADDLPRPATKSGGQGFGILLSDKPFKDFVVLGQANLQSDLDKYDIQDRTTLQAYYTTLQQIAIFENRQADAIARSFAKIRELETAGIEKADERTGAPLLFEAEKIAGADQAKFQAALSPNFRSRISALPWDKVGEDIKSAKGVLRSSGSDPVMAGFPQLDPMVAMNRTSFGRFREHDDRHACHHRPHPSGAADGCRGLFWDHRLPRGPRSDTWTPTGPGFDPSESDSGRHLHLGFGRRIRRLYLQFWVNEKEPPTRTTTTGTGLSATNGIAYDKDEAASQRCCTPVSGMKSPLDTVTARQGLQDARASIRLKPPSSRSTSPARSPNRLKDFQEDWPFGMYSHGNLRRGIASKATRSLGSSSPGWLLTIARSPETAPSEEQASHRRHVYRDTVNYMKAAGVRVVNMSWGGSRDVENELTERHPGANKGRAGGNVAQIFKIGGMRCRKRSRGAGYSLTPRRATATTTTTSREMIRPRSRAPI